LVTKFKNEVGACCMVYLCSVNGTASGVFHANRLPLPTCGLTASAEMVKRISDC
jgi:hypothetical protein